MCQRSLQRNGKVIIIHQQSFVWSLLHSPLSWNNLNKTKSHDPSAPKMYVCKYYSSWSVSTNILYTKSFHTPYQNTICRHNIDWSFPPHLMMKMLNLVLVQRLRRQFRSYPLVYYPQSAKQCDYIDRNNTWTAVAASFASFILFIFYNDSEARNDTKARLWKSNPASGRLTDTSGRIQNSVWLG